MAEQLLYNLKLATAKVGLDSIWALRKLIWDKELPVVQFRPGGKMYVAAEDLEKLINNHKKD